ncbi:C40 family peptidase [Thermoactinomyces mirandus]|nr:C40 family peptidase [Thermoactinomyces mirandus]
MEEEDMMPNSKKLKKWGITVVASLVISVGFPAGITHAATLDTKNVQSIITQIFSQFGWKWDAGKIANAQPVNTQTSQSGKSLNQTETSDHETNTENNDATAKETKQEQSNELQAALADKIIATGEKYLGTPYEFGAKSGQTNTFDCSSFVQHVYKENGIDLPRNSRQQSQVGQTVSKSEIQKGDLLFFELRSNPGRIGHVGIYAGNNKILHTWGPGGVRYDDLSDGWLKEGFVKAKRVIQ